MLRRSAGFSVSVLVLILIVGGILATRIDVFAKREKQIAAVQAATIPAGFNLPTSIQSISISDDSPASIWWIPNDQKSVIAQILPWLKIATPFTEKVPQSEDIDFHANIGPSILYITSSDKHEIMIYPAWYVKREGQKVDANSVVHYVQDIVAFKNGDQITYLESAPLYTWLKTDEWKTEFVRK